MIISSDFLHKHGLENVTHFPITHTGDRPKDFIFHAGRGVALGPLWEDAEHHPEVLSILHTPLMAVGVFAQSVYASFVCVRRNRFCSTAFRGTLPLHDFIGASLTRNLCISLTCFCLCNSPNMLGVSSATNRAPRSPLDNLFHHIKDVIVSWDSQ